MTCYYSCGRSGSVSETLRSTISLYGYGKITWPVISNKYWQTTLPRRKSQATRFNNDLIASGGTPDLISVEYKSKNQKRPPTTERIPGPKINSRNSAAELLSLKNSLQQKGIPKTIKLGNKNNDQDINALLKIHSPKALIILNAQINPPSPPSAPQIGTPFKLVPLFQALNI